MDNITEMMDIENKNEEVKDSCVLRILVQKVNKLKRENYNTKSIINMNISISRL